MKFFLSHQLYGTRPIRHVACYQLQPGWWFIEFGSWTLEVEPALKFTPTGRAAIIAASALVGDFFNIAHALYIPL